MAGIAAALGAAAGTAKRKVGQAAKDYAGKSYGARQQGGQSGKYTAPTDPAEDSPLTGLVKGAKKKAQKYISGKSG